MKAKANIQIVFAKKMKNKKIKVSTLDKFFNMFFCTGIFLFVIGFAIYLYFFYIGKNITYSQQLVAQKFTLTTFLFALISCFLVLICNSDKLPKTSANKKE